MSNMIEKKYEEVSQAVGLTKYSKFDVLVIDPPWNQGKTGKRKSRPNQDTDLDYSTLSEQELSLLPVEKWSKGNCFIFLWVTNSKDRDTQKPIIQLGFELLEHWGFKYNTFITWDKKTGPCPFSPFQITTEHIIFGYKGTVKYNKESLGKIQTCFTETAKSHSVKPDYFYYLIDKYFDGDKLDVFARKKRKGFWGWGDQYNQSELIDHDSNLEKNLSLF